MGLNAWWGGPPAPRPTLPSACSRPERKSQFDQSIISIGSAENSYLELEKSVGWVLILGHWRRIETGDLGWRRGSNDCVPSTPGNNLPPDPPLSMRKGGLYSRGTVMSLLGIGHLWRAASELLALRLF